METSTPPSPFEDIDGAALRAQVAACDAALGKYVDEIDYRNLSWYVSRACLRYALGGDPAAVTDDLWLAARCLQGRESMHLDRIPVERFLTRRILPIELGLLSGQPAITRDLAEGAGFSVPTVIANESEELFREAGRLTSWFRRGSCATHQDLAGLGAVVFGGALAAISRGFDDEAALGLNLFADAREPFRHVEPPEKVAAVLRRYDGLLLSLACLLRNEPDRLAHVLAGVVEGYCADLRHKLGAELLTPTEPHHYLDLSSLAILAIAALRRMEVPVSSDGPVGGYAAIYRFFMTSPPREAQPLSGLDEQSKALLRSMGVSDETIDGAQEPPPEG
ncbi:MAG: hypothetical protein AMXMBFR64_26190 [Myxococcales bacterium]